MAAVAQAVDQVAFADAVVGTGGEQLALIEGLTPPAPRRPMRVEGSPLCAGCREKEARYGFREENRPERPRTLCFECFRVELTRRQAAKDRLARGWNAEQVGLPLQDTLDALNLRRRRAQIAARHAIGA